MVAVLYILIFMVVVPFFAPMYVSAQSQHLTQWKVYDHIFDFTTNPTAVSEYPYNVSSWCNWLIDSNGEVAIDCRDGGLYFKNGKKIDDIQDIWLFVPAPQNERFVYCLGDDVIFRVDSDEGVITDKFPMHLGPETAVAVHSYDCEYLWLLVYSDCKNVVVYRVTFDGLYRERVVQLNTDDYKPTTYNSEPSWSFQLSMDCRYYTFSSTDNSTTYFGFFDRSDATFSRKFSHTFSGYDYISNSIISPDNSRIYYVLFNKKNWKVDFCEVRIVDGLPDYSTAEVFHSIKNERNDVGLYYGIDGKVYFMGAHIGVYGTIDIVDDKAVYEDFASFPTHWVRTHHSMPSWYLPFPCGNNPCKDMKPPAIKIVR